MNRQSAVYFFFLIVQVLLHRTEGETPLSPSEILRRNSRSIIKGIAENIPGSGIIQSAVDTAVDTASEAIDYVVPDCLFGADQVGFILFTREHSNGIEIEFNTTNIPLTGNKTIFVIHGFLSEANTTNYKDLANAWLELSPVNVISVDWKEGACTKGLGITDALAYPSAVSNTVTVGRHVANFTRKLHDEYGLIVNDTVVCGHSLGAHVAGFAGKGVQELGLGRYQQIVGLDPAGPGFEGLDCKDRLCVDDAHFVVAFHTTILLGIHQNVGDNDFYFNGAVYQPNCILTTCSHSRAVVYLTESLNDENCHFVGTRYNKVTGGRVDEDSCTMKDCSIANPQSYILPSRGTFYVKTKSEEPYCSTSPVKFLNGLQTK